METDANGWDISQLSIERMRISDLDEVMEIERTCFRQPWTREMFESDLLQTEFTYYIVAKLKGKLIGYAGMWVAGGEAHITTIAVHPNYRRKGVGSTLMRTLLEEALRRGAEIAVLEVRQSNTAAQKLYRKYGFRPVGVRRNYYSNPTEDALVYELSPIKDAIRMCSDAR